MSTALVTDVPMTSAPAANASVTTASVTTAQYRTLLAARREQLVQRAQQQRVQLAHSLEPALRVALWVDRGAGLWHAARRRPALALAGGLVPALALAIWKPRAVLRAFAAALALWRIRNAWAAAARAPGASFR